jgi:hypothetical protein
MRSNLTCASLMVTGHTLAAQAAAAAAAEASASAEVEAACVKGGWALLQGLCCIGPGWIAVHWTSLCAVLHSEFTWQTEELRGLCSDAPASSTGAATAVSGGPAPGAASSGEQSM